MSVRAMLTLIILQKLHTEPVNFSLAYNRADIKLEIYVDLPLIFGVDGAHIR